jgi:hypothetical protein
VKSLFSVFLCLSVLFSIALNAENQIEEYTAITKFNGKIDKKSFQIKGNRFVSPKNTYNVSTFNSLTDFSAQFIQYSGSYWSQYEYVLNSFIPEQIQNYKNVGFGSFKLYAAGGSPIMGSLALGKSLSQDTIEKIQELSTALIFEGNSINLGASLILFITVNPQTGFMQGTIGDYLVESQPNGFNGKYEGYIYTLRLDNTREIVGRFLLNIYGEEFLEMAGGVAINGKGSDLVYLKRVD